MHELKSCLKTIFYAVIIAHWTTSGHLKMFVTTFTNTKRAYTPTLIYNHFTCISYMTLSCISKKDSSWSSNSLSFHFVIVKQKHGMKKVEKAAQARPNPSSHLLFGFFFRDSRQSSSLNFFSFFLSSLDWLFLDLKRKKSWMSELLKWKNFKGGLHFLLINTIVFNDLWIYLVWENHYQWEYVPHEENTP